MNFFNINLLSRAAEIYAKNFTTQELEELLQIVSSKDLKGLFELKTLITTRMVSIREQFIRNIESLCSN